MLGVFAAVLDDTGRLLGDFDFFVDVDGRLLDFDFFVDVDRPRCLDEVFFFSDLGDVFGDFLFLFLVDFFFLSLGVFRCGMVTC